MTDPGSNIWCIDLGDDGLSLATRDPSGKPRIFNFGNLATRAPAAIFTDKHFVRVGREAAAYAALEPQQFENGFISRLIADDDSAPNPAIDRALEHCFAWVKSQAAPARGTPDRLILTIPPAFTAPQQMRLSGAARKAGFPEPQLLSAARAALLAAAFESQRVDHPVLVVDVGDRRCDISVVRMDENRIEELAVTTRTVGGRNFTEALLDNVSGQMRVASAGDPRANPQGLNQLFAQCEHAKRSFATVNGLSLSGMLNDRLYDLTLTRARYEEATASLCQTVLDAIREVLGRCDHGLADVYLLTVGGGSLDVGLQQHLTKLPAGARCRSGSPLLAAVVGGIVSTLPFELLRGVDGASTADVTVDEPTGSSAATRAAASSAPPIEVSVSSPPVAAKPDELDLEEDEPAAIDDDATDVDLQELLAAKFYLRENSEVTGPHSTDALRVLIKSGCVSSLAEISTDQNEWHPARLYAEALVPEPVVPSVPDPSPAAELTAQPVSTPEAPPPAPEPQSVSAAPDTAVAAPGEASLGGAVPQVDQWLYQTGGKVAGPVTLVNLQKLIASRRIRRATLVCRQGQENWLRADDLPIDFPTTGSRSRIRKLLIAGAGVIVTLAVVSGLWWYANQRQASPQTAPSTSNGIP